MGEWLNTAVREIYELSVITRAQLSPAATFLVFDPVAGGLRQINKSELKYGLGVVEYVPDEAISPHTGDTLETTLATVTISGGLLKANSVIEILHFWHFNGNAGPGTADIKVKFGDATFAYFEKTMSEGDGPYAQGHTIIYCNNSVAAQKAFNPGAYSPFGSSGNNNTSSVNTAVDVAITFTGDLSDAADTITLEGYRIKLNDV